MNALPGPGPPSLVTPLVHRPFQWADLSLDEKMRCKGSKCPTKRLGKHAWFIEGFLQDLYDSKLDGTIEKLVEDDHKKIYKDSKSGLNWLPLLLGESDDGQDAEPVILLLTEDADLGERARRMILRSSRYRMRSFGFVVLVDRREIQIPADTIVGDRKRTYHSAEEAWIVRINNFFGDVGAIQRRTAFVRRVNQQSDSPWSTVTLGGLLLIEGTYYALTVAHFLFSRLNDEDTADMGAGEEEETASIDKNIKQEEIATKGINAEEADTIDTKVNIKEEDTGLHNPDDDNRFENSPDSGFCEDPSSYEDDDEDEDASPSSRPKIDSTFSSFILQYLGDFDIYIDCHTTYTASKFVPTGFQNTEKLFYPVCLGRLELRELPGIEDLKYSLMSHNSDWCLLPMVNSRLQHNNKFTLPSGKSVLVNRVNRTQRRSGSKVFVAAGTSGVFETSIIGPTSNYVFPWAERVHKVISIFTTIEPGDSGAWVFDHDGYFYGIAVATVPSLSITYVLRAEDILQDIATRRSITADLDTFLPTKPPQKSGESSPANSSPADSSPAQAKQSIIPSSTGTVRATYGNSSSRRSPAARHSTFSSPSATSFAASYSSSSHSSSGSSTNSYSSFSYNMRRRRLAKIQQPHPLATTDSSRITNPATHERHPVYETIQE